MEKPPFGTELGENRSVVGYSNGPKRGKTWGEFYINGHYTGIKYQCVEYARRWLIVVKGLTFKSVMCACDIWSLDHVLRIDTQERIRLVRVPNGSPVPPEVGALLIYKRRFGLPFGHVSVITDVDPNFRYIRISEQNVEDEFWPGDYARELRLEKIGENFHVRDKYTLYGWMAYENVPELKEEGSKCVLF